MQICCVRAILQAARLPVPTLSSLNSDNPLGHNYFHSIVDGHCRLAYGELLADENAATVTAFVKRALAWFADHHIQCRRLMSDAAWAYTCNRTLRELLTQNEIRHIVTPPYTPRWKRQGRTLPPDHATRVGQGCPLPQQHHPQPGAATLAALLQRAQAHSSLGNRPPISRARNLSGQV